MPEDQAGHTARAGGGGAAEQFFGLSQAGVDPRVGQGVAQTVTQQVLRPLQRFVGGDLRPFVPASEQPVPVGGIRVRAGVPDGQRAACQRAGAREMVL